jgi:short-subunit dehydrogenase
VLIKGAVALVTGASSGIGAAIAESLADKGARVLVHGRDERRLHALAQKINARPIVGDLQRAGAAETVARYAGGVDILVANAGVGWAGPVAEMAAADVERIVAVNLTAPIQLTRALLPAMDTNGRGFLLYVTSIAGRTGVAGEAVYAGAKAGLDAFAESLRLELRGRGIGVGVLVPGVIDTAFFANRGRPYGRSRPKPLPVGPIAHAAVRMIETGRAEVYRPRWLRAPVAIRGLAPGAYRVLAGRFGGS